MIRSYFQMAKRSSRRTQRHYGHQCDRSDHRIASALVIFTVIRYELSFDAFHSDRDRIYRLVRGRHGSRQSGASRLPHRRVLSVPTALKTEIPAIGEIASVQYFGDLFVEVPDASATCFAGIAKKADAVMIEPSFQDLSITRTHASAGSPATRRKHWRNP